MLDRFAQSLGVADAFTDPEIVVHLQSRGLRLQVAADVDLHDAAASLDLGIDQGQQSANAPSYCGVSSKAGTASLAVPRRGEDCGWTAFWAFVK